MPETYKSITARKNIGLFVFGDHASNYIPPEYDNLGVSGPDLSRHIAWDIGTEIVVRYLCEHFGAAGQLAGVSRLAMDLNRDPNMDSAVPVDSDGTIIPGNQNLTDAERRSRIDKYHTPYHTALSGALADMQSRHDDPLAVSIHSFTSKPDLGEHRLLDFGLLVKHDEPSAAALTEMFMRLGRNFTMAVNEPYSAYDLNYTVDTAVAPRGLRHLAIEINQDLIDTNKKALEIAKILADRMEPIVWKTFRAIGG